MGSLNDVLVLFGDSQTEFASRPGGFVNRLSQHFSRVYDVVNRGFSGYTTDQALVLAPRIFPPQDSQQSGTSKGKVRLVTIWFGSNDAAVEGHRQHVPLARFRQNLEQVIDIILENAGADTKIVLITPAALIPATELVGNSRRPEITRTYVEAVLAIADARKSPNIVAMDLFSSFEDIAGKHFGTLRPLLAEDGLHISDFGYELIFHKLINIIQRWPELNLDCLQRTYPSWKDVLPEQGQGVPLEPQANVMNQ
ncbi:isoamyl acetate-hydrolyzing esterase [Tilletia horrida]|nr:isoamyl acetate-hydrolyzing esterase [Tilletia horrida]